MRTLYKNSIAGLICLMLALPVAAQQAPPVPEPNTETHLFQVVVVIGSKATSKPSTEVPANAKKALDDIGQFLPYKSYSMVDTALIRSARRGQGLMAGPDNDDYRVQLVYTKSSRTGKIFVEGFELVDLNRGSNALLISTSFEVELRETIVVGSSKLNGGDEALIVLFTAVQ